MASRGQKRVLILLLLVGAGGAWLFWDDIAGPKETGLEGITDGVAGAQGPGPLETVHGSDTTPIAVGTPKIETPKAETPIGGGDGGGRDGGSLVMGQRDRATTPERAEVPERTVLDVPAAERGGVIASLVELAEDALDEGRPVSARDYLNRALHHASASASDREALRMRLSILAEELTFGPKIVAGDPMTRSYTVKPGEVISAIAPRQGTELDDAFILRVNNIADATRVPAGKALKLVQGPFHAVVVKDRFRLDLYADERDAEGNRIYLRSFRVGLGEYGSTPIGEWIVPDKPNAKAVNPSWRNPRTGEVYPRGAADNPIGTRWIALQGTDQNTELMESYGIHGTIEPETIGTEASMGCVRLVDEDIKLLYEVLMPGRSTVVIIPTE